MVPLPGALHETRKAHLPALEKCGTKQDKEGDYTAHPTGVLSWQKAEALDQAGVVV